MTHSQIPIIRKGIIIPNLGAKSVEKYQKRYSKKQEQKLQKKLARFEKKFNKLIAKGEPVLFKGAYRRKVARLGKKIQAIQAVLGIQPFDMALQEQAQMEAMITQPASSAINPILIGVGGLIVLGGLTLLLMKK